MSDDDARERRFRELYAGTYPDLVRFVRRRADPASVDDVVAEAFLVAWRRLDDVPVRPGPRVAWLYAVARHCLLNERRGGQRRENLAVRVADEPRVAHAADERAGFRVDLAAAWRRLSAAEQEVLALALWEDLPSAEASVVLGVSPAAYRLRLSRARRALRALLDPDDPPVPARAGTAPLQEPS